ncbi:UNVERIFIED_CONTAM: hypothetical protein GTU68_003794 [Idotea baltica]|nr:hypothetical protein [Idotea baltica]
MHKLSIIKMCVCFHVMCQSAEKLFQAASQPYQPKNSANLQKQLNAPVTWLLFHT